jgi:hypothetical protein
LGPTNVVRRENSEPKGDLGELLQLEGITLWRGAGDYDVMLAVNPSRELMSNLRKDPLKIPSIAIVLEPRVTTKISAEKYLQSFTKVLAPTSAVKGFVAIPWPNEAPKKPFHSNTVEERKSMFCMIAADKFSWIEGELYSLRRSAVRLESVEAFGTGWNIGHARRCAIAAKEFSLMLQTGDLFPTTFRQQWTFFTTLQNKKIGSIENKSMTYAEFNFALVIENSMELQSEKLFDALMSKCIPVYVGPPNLGGRIPEELFFRSEPSLLGIKDAMERARKVNFKKWLGLLSEWYVSEAVSIEKSFSNEIANQIRVLSSGGVS